MKKFYYIISILFAISLISCGKSTTTIKRLQKIEEGVDNPTSVEELKSAIKKFEDRAKDLVLTQEQIGIWYKILGSRYIEDKMYGEALKSYQKALEYYPSNQNLYYWVGVCAGLMAKESLDFTASGNREVSLNYIDLAESAYKRAIELDSRYERAWYGLGSLYSYKSDEFQSDDYAKAVDCYEHALEISTKSIDTMANLARAYYGIYEFDKAIAMYDKIINTTKSQSVKTTAEELKKQVLDAAY